MSLISVDVINCINSIKNLNEKENKKLIDTLEHLAYALDRELGNNLISIIICGSLCAGDFDSQTSDVDILVITKKALSDNDYFLISHMHNGLKMRHAKWGSRLELSYITQVELYTLTPPENPRIYLNGGMTKQEPYGAEWYFEKHSLKNHGIVMYGTDFDQDRLEVSSTKLRVAAFQIIMEWWKPIIDSGLHKLSDEYLIYGVLSMCRMIMTIESGEVGSKKEAAGYVLENDPSKYDNLILNLVLSRNRDDFDRSTASEFIKVTVEKYL